MAIPAYTLTGTGTLEGNEQSEGQIIELNGLGYNIKIKQTGNKKAKGTPKGAPKLYQPLTVVNS